MLVPKHLADLGPVVLGGTGGSGTRMVARVVHKAGLFIGSNRNESEDAIDFGAYSDRWINALTAHREGPLAADLESIMLRDLEAVMASHLGGLGGPRQWGWKEPRSIFLLSFFHHHLPALRFLHVVRDGRDIAFSPNQNQLRKHGEARGIRGLDPVHSAELWSQLNLEAASYGEDRLGPRYLRIRFEDLCSDPVSEALRIFDFLELDGDPRQAAAEVVPPASLGRWRKEDSDTVALLTRSAREALDRFGYRAPR
jgi:hypothetical protein